MNTYNAQIQQSDRLKDKSKKTIAYLTRGEAAKYLRISVRTLDKLTKNGVIPHYKLGGNNSKVLFRYDDLIAYIEGFRIDV